MASELEAGMIPEKPMLSRRSRLRYDEVRKSHVLLLPERVVLLGDTSAEILTLCDGSRTVSAIVEELQARYPEADIAGDVTDFLREATARKWLDRTVTK